MNRSPVLVQRVPDVRFLTGHALDYDLGAGFFSDPDGDALSYEFVTWDAAAVSRLGLMWSGSRIVGRPLETGSLEIQVQAKDSRGGVELDHFWLSVERNSPPVLAAPHPDRLLNVGEGVDIDATQGGTTFTDADGDPLRYEVVLESEPRGIAISGLRVQGAVNSVGLVRVRVMVSDGAGGVAEDAFSLATAGPVPGEPTLPATPYRYADSALPLPYVYQLSSDIVIPFWDTQPDDNRTTDAGAALGRVLFYDKRLSITNTVSCGSCHEQQHGFAQPTRFSVGAQGVPTKRNAMALTDVRYAIRNHYLWDARAPTLERLAVMPIEESMELGNPMSLLVPKLQATAFYPPLFEAAFGTPEVTADRIAKALAQFLRALISYEAKFDRAVYGMTIDDYPDTEAILTAEEYRGMQLFHNDPGVCGHCHVDGVMTMGDPASNGLDIVSADPGAGQGLFRSPSLRNVVESAPYMHDGRFATLREVIDHYDRGISDSPSLSSLLREGSYGPPMRFNFSEKEKDALEAFLRTLTDDRFLQDPKFSDPF
jgi:cytochrome c peroxidase